MSKKPFLKRRRNDFIYVIVLIMVIIVTRLPRRVGLAMFGAVGALFFMIHTSDRRNTISNLTDMFGAGKSRRDIIRRARQVYINLTQNLFDAIYLSRQPNEKFYQLVDLRGTDDLEAAFKEKHGGIVMSGHLGCFEIMTHAVARRGIECFTVGQKLYDPRIDALVQKMRGSENITYMHRNGSARDIIRYLRTGKMFGVLIDQDTHVEGVFVNFLGRPAFTPSAPMRMAMSLDVPVFVSWTARMDDGRHVVQYTPRIEMQKTGNMEKDLVANIQKVTDVFCEALMQYPDQWVWMHRRWKTIHKND